jgi:8-oxo-dGTP pyrophosphatase MutT (NUDIX family)
MKKKEIFKPLLCRNCGLNGHIYKNCPHPIMSFGLICYKIDENKEIKYLMLQRKDSLSFMEFIKGKYNIDDFDYIKVLLSNMTISERNMIINENFDNIWNYLWCQNSNNPIKNTKEYIESKSKFNNFIIISLYINYIKSIIGLYNEQEWGFPKGRRKIKESDLDCAVREFYEETRIINNDIEVINDILPFEGNDSLLFAATDAGVYATVNMGVNWYRVGTNMPILIVDDVEFNASTGRLIAGTHGRSIMTYPLDKILTDLAPDMVFAMDVKIYPNPTTDVLNIRMPAAKKPTIKIFSVNGKQIPANTNGTNTFTLDVANFPAGIYYLVAEEGKFRAVKKFVKS